MGFAIYDAIAGGTPDYAGQAQNAEQKRQQAITTGTASINKAFAGYNPQFYANRAQAYTDFALPQLSDQYREARNQVGFGLANKGIQRSGAANKAWSDLFRTNALAKQNVVDQGVSQSQALQQQVEGARTGLFNQLYQSADPAGASSQAVATAAGFQTPSTWAPLTNQFSNLVNQYYLASLLNQRQPATVPQGGSYGSTFAPLPSTQSGN